MASNPAKAKPAHSGAEEDGVPKRYAYMGVSAIVLASVAGLSLAGAGYGEKESRITAARMEAGQVLAATQTVQLPKSVPAPLAETMTPKPVEKIEKAPASEGTELAAQTAKPINAAKPSPAKQPAEKSAPNETSKAAPKAAPRG
mgnify:FL=1